MGIIVCKFGGTSTACENGLKRISEIMIENGDRRYVILSAPGVSGDAPKVTDMLCSLWDAWNDTLAGRIVERYAKIARALAVPLDEGLALNALRRAASVSRQAMISRGEYLIARLYSRYAGLPIVDAADIIRFTREGILDVGDTLKRVEAMCRNTPKAVIPGFYGADPEGNVATFPRNGSDITGALVAAGAGAALYENWTDVPGLMTDDPAVNPSARVIPEITYREMRRRAERGARVLHPDCLGPVEAAGIPTHIRCTMNPDLPGTVVHN